MSKPSEPVWAALSAERHAGWSWRPNPHGLRFSANRGLVAVTDQELAQLVGQFVLAVQRQSGRWRLVALLSLFPDQNAYVDGSGRWRAPYVPAHLRGYPFAAVPTPEGTFVAGVDEGSGLLDATGVSGEPLFGPQGKPTAETGKILRFLDQVAKAQTTTADKCEELAAAGLLEPWRPVVPERMDRRHKELHRVDAKRFAQLEADTLLSLHQSGALALAHALIFSQSRLKWLGRYHTAQGAAIGKAVDEAFEQREDEFTFDFDR